VNCPNCGEQIPADADYCPRCGRDLRPRGSFPWVPTLLAFVAGAALCAVIGLVAGVGKTTTDTVIAHSGGHPRSTATVSTTKTKTKTKHVTVSGPTHTVKAKPATKTVSVTSTATVSTTATTTTTVSTTKTVTAGG
jgi:hypothetical protein